MNWIRTLHEEEPAPRANSKRCFRRERNPRNGCCRRQPLPQSRLDEIGQLNLMASVHPQPEGSERCKDLCACRGIEWVLAWVGSSAATSKELQSDVGKLSGLYEHGHSPVPVASARVGDEGSLVDTSRRTSEHFLKSSERCLAVTGLHWSMHDRILPVPSVGALAPKVSRTDRLEVGPSHSSTPNSEISAPRSFSNRGELQAESIPVPLRTSLSTAPHGALPKRSMHSSSVIPSPAVWLSCPRTRWCSRSR